MSTATAVLLAGLPGSGKTTLAKALEAHGLARLSPDEEMHRRHGRYGVDYPRGTFTVRERPVLADLRAELAKLLTAGRSVVLDHGLWTRAERDEWREAVAAASGLPLLLYLPATHAELWARVQDRNIHGTDSDIRFQEHDLQRFAERFEPPDDDEDPTIYRADNPAPLLALIQARQRPHDEAAASR